MAFLPPTALAVVVLDAIAVVLALTALHRGNARVYLGWDFGSYSARQYKLEKRAHLTAAVISFAAVVKIPSLVFFFFALDRLSYEVPGAMCGVGVLQAMPMGPPLLAGKVFLFIFLAIWVGTHRHDVSTPDLRHTPLKFALFFLACGAMAVELVAELAAFAGLETTRIVSCCGTLFTDTDPGRLPLFVDVSQPAITTATIACGAVVVLAWRLHWYRLLGVANAAFLALSVAFVIAVVSPYVYQNPHHHCPFCITKANYYFAGFLLYGMLLWGTASGIWAGFSATLLSHEDDAAARRSAWLGTSFLLLSLAYPAVYYLRNGVFL